jgi:hypothetical protein
MYDCKRILATWRQRLYIIRVWNAACSKTSPSKVSVDHAEIPEDIFNTLDFELNVKLAELHTSYHLQMLNITMMTVWCM